MKPDPAESGGTNDLLRALIYATNQTTIEAPTFSAPHSVVASNFFFFASLFCSLFSAFGAVLGKQWLSEYERVGEKPLPYERGLQRHSKYLSMKRNHCELVIQMLGSVLQASLFLFFIALSNWLWYINRVMAGLVIAGTIITAIFFIVTTCHSLFRDYSPFSTRFSCMLRELWAPSDKLRPSASSHSCIVWLRKHATSFQSVKAMAEAWTRCECPGDEEPLKHEDVSSDLIGAIVSSDAITTGSEDGTLFSTVRAIKRVAPWDENSKPSERDKQVVHGLKQALRRAQDDKDVQDPVLCEMIVSSLPRSSFPHWKQDLSHDPIDRKVLVDIASSPLVEAKGRSTALLYLWEEHLSELERKLPSALINGETWPWKIAGALAKDAQISHPTTFDPVCMQFRLHWAIRLGLHALSGSAASPAHRTAWKELFLKEPFEQFISQYKKQDHPTDPYYWGRLVLFKWVAHEQELHSISAVKTCKLDYHYDIFDPVSPRPGRPYVVTTAMTDAIARLKYIITHAQIVPSPEGRYLLFGPLLWWYHLANISKGSNQRSSRPGKGKELELVAIDYLRVIAYNLWAELKSSQKTLTPWIASIVHDAVYAYSLNVEQQEKNPPSASSRSPPPLKSVISEDLDRALLDRAFDLLRWVSQGEIRIADTYQPLYAALKEALRVITNGGLSKAAQEVFNSWQLPRSTSKDPRELFIYFDLPAGGWVRVEPESEKAVFSLSQHMYIS